jgi:hypothetical protein
MGLSLVDSRRLRHCTTQTITASPVPKAVPRSKFAEQAHRNPTKFPDRAGPLKRFQARRGAVLQNLSDAALGQFVHHEDLPRCLVAGEHFPAMGDQVAASNRSIGILSGDDKGRDFLPEFP